MILALGSIPVSVSISPTALILVPGSVSFHGIDPVSRINPGLRVESLSFFDGKSFGIVSEILEKEELCGVPEPRALLGLMECPNQELISRLLKCDCRRTATLH